MCGVGRSNSVQFAVVILGV